MTAIRSRFLKLALAVAAFVAAVSSASAQHCQLDAPTLAAAQLKVKLNCQPAAGPQTVPYPDGPLFVGVTLYKLPSSAARAITRLNDDAGSAPLHVAAQEIRRPEKSAELTFRLPANVTQTHVLVAVWDQKNACENDDRACRRMGHTLGKADGDGNPVPVDAWPAPACNIGSLDSRGYFKWSENAMWGAPSEDEDMMSLARLNDCWIRNAAWPGRGLSYRKWRVAPLPR